MEAFDKYRSTEEAAKWASKYLKRKISVSNISYLIQYGKIKKHTDKKGRIIVDIIELQKYYDEEIISREEEWKRKLGEDLNWNLSFDDLREKDTTKHVHKLHPYKGKYIPQLVEYFLSNQTNGFKKEAFFKDGDIILDPFLGSGTTIIQCLEMGLHSIGIEISKFNGIISKVKAQKYDIALLNSKLNEALIKSDEYSENNFDSSLQQELLDRISGFNKEYFPGSTYRYKVKNKEINETEYSTQILTRFFNENSELIEKIEQNNKKLQINSDSDFLEKWFTNQIKHELFFYKGLIDKENDNKVREVMTLILSRTARSCRATTHSDLATLRSSQEEPYYCHKHFKICTPVNTILRHLKNYTNDTINRITEFSKIRKNVEFAVIHDDSRTVDIRASLKSHNPQLYETFQKNKITGVFTSPPYVGQIDYHEQHAYSYDLFSIDRRDDLEIGPKSKGKSKKAQEQYIKGISDVLSNIKQFVKDDGHFFIVANDKLNLYSEIAEKSGLKIVNTFRRPVLNRTERDKQPYAETIFHMKKL